MATIKELLSKMIDKINGIPKKLSELEVDVNPSWNDLEDKPFYSGDIIVIDNWDGSIEGKEIVADVFIKFSDNPIPNFKESIDSEKYSYETVVPDGYELEKIDGYSELMPGLKMVGITYNNKGNRATVALINVEEDAPLDGTVIIPKGVYTIPSDGYFKNFKIEGDVKQLDEKFIPEHLHNWNDLKDKPFGEELQQTYLLNDAAPISSEEAIPPTLGYMHLFESALNIELDKNYKVVINDVEYNITSKDISEVSTDLITESFVVEESPGYLGSYSDYAFGDIPFIIFRFNNRKDYLAVYCMEQDIVVSISEVNEEIIRLDEKFIPDTIARVVDIPEPTEQVQPDWNQNDETAPDYVKNRPFYMETATVSLLEKTSLEMSLTGNKDEYYTHVYLNRNLILDEWVKVIWNDVIYECKVWEYDHCMMAGDMKLVDTPFILWGFDTGKNEYSVYTTLDNGAVSTVSVICEQDVLRTNCDFVVEATFTDESEDIKLTSGDFTTAKSKVLRGLPVTVSINEIYLFNNIRTIYNDITTAWHVMNLFNDYEEIVFWGCDTTYAIKSDNTVGYPEI